MHSLCLLPHRCGCTRPLFLYVELRGVPRHSQRLPDADGAVLQQHVGAELEKCVRPHLLILHLHFVPWWGTHTHTHTTIYVCIIFHVFNLLFHSRLPVFPVGARWPARKCRSASELCHLYVLGRKPLPLFWQKALPFPGWLHLPAGLILWRHLGSLHTNRVWRGRSLQQSKEKSHTRGKEQYFCQPRVA